MNQSPAAKWALAVLAPAMFAGCAARGGVKAASVPHEEQIEAWHGKRIASLQKDHGWLTLVGLEWLSEGENRIGAAAGSDVVLRGEAPDSVGVLVVTEGVVRFRAAPDVEVLFDGAPVEERLLATDADGGAPDKLTVGTLSFVVIRRGERLAARIYDTQAVTRQKFDGIDRYPVRPEWRIEARFEAYDPPKTVRVPTVTPGYEEESPVPGVAVFTVDGTEYRLEPTGSPGDEEYFFVFGDATNGPETYGAGRFLYARAPENGTVVLDFNKAYNPPCAFTPYATCPLPTPENRLPVRVTAGEKNYGEH